MLHHRPVLEGSHWLVHLIGIAVILWIRLTHSTPDSYFCKGFTYRCKQPVACWLSVAIFRYLCLKLGLFVLVSVSVAELSIYDIHYSRFMRANACPKANMYMYMYNVLYIRFVLLIGCSLISTCFSIIAFKRLCFRWRGECLVVVNSDWKGSC